MFRDLYDWTLRLAAHAHARYWLAVVSFMESSIFPIPPDAMLIPMVLARRAMAWEYAAICTVASVVGGLFGYAIGYFLFEAIGAPLLDFYGYADQFEEFGGMYNEWGAWIVFIAGLTPFPYKVITIASGVTQLDLMVFLLASVLARGIRFFAVSGLLYIAGPTIRGFIEKYFGILTVVFVILLIAGLAAIRFIF